MAQLRSRSRARQRAFTLIELLVVIFIVGIMVSVAILSVSVLGKDTEVRDEMRRLESLIDMVREQGEMQNRDFGLRLENNASESAYQFLRFDVRRNEWLAVDDSLLRRRVLPPGVRARLYVEAREVQLRRPTDPKAPWPPQIMVLSSGDLTSFELRLEREGSDAEARMVGEADGTIEVKGPDEEKR
ncbi:MAG TPA: type II secretion system minor pseudopilin GspH [Steroidobacteraceae bacterium]|nr:type II secretion system minor pseudopilin GspH [Steroidobacteraceae bacterium]